VCEKNAGPRSPPGLRLIPAFKGERGRRQTVRNGHHPDRPALATSKSSTPDPQPPPPGQGETFASTILPLPPANRCVEGRGPWLSRTDSFRRSVRPARPRRSTTTDTRLKAAWETPEQASAGGTRYVHGMHFDIRLDEGRSCIPVLMGRSSPERRS